MATKAKTRKQLAVTDTAPEKTVTSDYNKILEENNNLDAYLGAEFVDDTQTDLAQGVLAAYLKELFPNAKTPRDMKAEIDKVDDAVKAFYWLTLVRSTSKGTLLSSKGGISFDTLKADDFAGKYDTDQGRMYRVARLAADKVIGGWPLKDPNKSNFVFSPELLVKVYTDVLPKISPLFANGVRKFDKTAKQVIARLGSYYGLQRYPVDQLEKQQGQVPSSSATGEGTDEEIVERNLLRFAFFGPQNIGNLVFENTPKNQEALELATEKVFRNAEFPKNIANASAPFEEKAKKIIATSELVNKPTMSEQQPVAPPAAPADAPAQPPVQDAPPAAQDAAQQAADVLAATADVPATEPSEAKCKAVEDAAVEAEKKAQELLDSIGKYDEQSVAAQKIIARQDTLIKQLMALKGNQQVLEGTRAGVEAELIKCQGDKKALEDEIVRLNTQIKQLQETIKALEEQERSLRQLAQNILTQIENYEAKVDDIFTLKDKVSLQLAAMDGTDEEKTAKLQSLVVQLDRRAKEIEQRIQDLQAEYAKTGEKGDAALEECKKTQEKLESTLKQVELLKAEIDRKGPIEEKLKRDLDACGAEAERLSKSFRVFCESQGGVFKRLNTQLQELSTKVTNSIASLAELVTKQDAQVKQYEENMGAVSASAAPVTE